MKFSESIRTTKHKVEELLEKYPPLRDSDKLLWLAYLVRYHNLKAHLGDEAYSHLKEIIMDTNTPTMESIRRVRQKLQEQGKYVGEKRKERLEEADKFKEIVRSL